jgi:glycosyltransferase involved in cell wall biosynthesis
MVEISFVIPAYNEQRYISQTIQSIRQHIGDRYSYEVIVVDHGSTDATAQLAAAAGADVYSAPEAGTISELRNIGVSHAGADVLIFLDADTTITKDWIINFPETFGEVHRNPLILTGSKREIPPTAGWVSRLWYRPVATEKVPTHLGGGHIITTKKLFNAIGGFSTDLDTGEDYDFCIRAKKSGARIAARPALRAMHHGVPRNLKQFFRREIWHGRGDWQKLQSVLESKVAVASIAFMLLHLSLLLDLMFQLTHYALSFLALFGIASICILSSVYQYKGQPVLVIVANSMLFYVYYLARSLSFFSVLRRRAAKKHMRGT